MVPVLLLAGAAGILWIWRLRTDEAAAREVEVQKGMTPFPTAPATLGSKSALLPSDFATSPAGLELLGFPALPAGMPSGLPGFEGFGGGFPDLSGFPLPLPDGDGAFGIKTPVTAASSVPRALPPGTMIRDAGGAEAPLIHHERVIFDVIAPSGSGTSFRGSLEGFWEGPEDADEVGTVAVDRIATRGGETGHPQLPFGRYTIPGAKHSGFHPKLERPSWYAVQPDIAGLRSLPSVIANISPGTLATVVLRDTHGATVAAVVEVRSGSNPYLVKPLRVYRVLVDEGAGPVVFTKNGAQLVKVDNSQFVDPTSFIATAATKGFPMSNARVGRDLRTVSALSSLMTASDLTMTTAPSQPIFQTETEVVQPRVEMTNAPSIQNVSSTPVSYATASPPRPIFQTETERVQPRVETTMRSVPTNDFASRLTPPSTTKPIFQTETERVQPRVEVRNVVPVPTDLVSRFNPPMQPIFPTDDGAPPAYNNAGMNSAPVNGGSSEPARGYSSSSMNSAPLNSGSPQPIFQTETEVVQPRLPVSGVVQRLRSPTPTTVTAAPSAGTRRAQPIFGSEADQPQRQGTTPSAFERRAGVIPPRAPSAVTTMDTNTAMGRDLRTLRRPL